METEPLYKKSAAGLSVLLQKREISALELMESTFAQIDRREAQIGAYLSLCREKAIAAASQVDRQRAKGEPLSPLAGIPFSAKDNLCTISLPTTCASRMLEGYRPPYTATAIKRLTNCGAILIGKTNLDEFAMGSGCQTSALGETKNPRDLSRLPGGSSGGSAAAVAACECAFSLGSDTGGSIRLPAAWCGVYGWKPTYGAVSRYGMIAFASSLDQIGPLTRTAKDLAMVLPVLYGKDEKDATSRSISGWEGLSCPDFLKGKRIGLIRETLDSSPAAFCEKTQQAAALFSSLGAQVELVSLSEWEKVLPAYSAISCAQAASNLARFDGIRFGRRGIGSTPRQQAENARAAGFGHEVQQRILLGNAILSDGKRAYYEKAVSFSRRLSEKCDSLFARFDFLLTPTTPIPSPRKTDVFDLSETDRFTAIANLTGIPAVSIPFGRDEEGLPVGVQLLAPAGRDATLLCAALELEKGGAGL